jgi:hypothetical protein
MIHDFKDLPALLALSPCSLVNWARFLSAAVLTVAVAGLEIWLRVPVRPVVDQLFTFRRGATTHKA